MDHDDSSLSSLLAADLDRNFGRLVTAYERPLLACTRKWARNEQDAQDIIQETFLRAYRYLKRSPEESICQLSLWSWLYKIALNYFLNTKRSQPKGVTVSYLEYDALPEIEINSEELPENIAENTEQRLKMQSLITDLPRYREVLWLFYFEELSLEEIATCLHKPIGTVKSDLYRGRELLRRVLVKPLDEVQENDGK